MAVPHQPHLRSFFDDDLHYELRVLQRDVLPHEVLRLRPSDLQLFPGVPDPNAHHDDRLLPKEAFTRRNLGLRLSQIPKAQRDDAEAR